MKQIRNLPVRDGSRARRLVRELNGLRSAEEKAALYKRYKELGIITEEIGRQLKAARQAGVLQ